MDLSHWEWTCACCGRRKRGVPDFGFDAPIHCRRAAQGDPDFSVLEKTDDHCVMEIDGNGHFFVRGVLPLPVHGAAEGLGIGAWTTLSEAGFLGYDESFHEPDRTKLGAMFGYLADRLPFCPDTRNLKLDVLPRDGRLRPRLRVWSDHADHPLHVDQAEGLGPDRRAALPSEIMPCEGRA